jgi:hypothetical protein
MFNKNTCLTVALSIFSISMPLSAATINKVETKIRLQIGDKVKEFDRFIIDSEKYSQISMDNENLGFAIKLINATEGRERFETVPTYNKEYIAKGFGTGKKMAFGAGSNINGHSFEKQLIIEFLTVKQLP